MKLALCLIKGLENLNMLLYILLTVAAIWHYFPVVRCAQRHSLSAPSVSPSVCVCLQHKLRYYISVMSRVVRHWVSQEWPRSAPDNITAGWQCFPVFMTLSWLSTLPKNNRWFNRTRNWRQREWVLRKNEGCCINGSQRVICFLWSKIASVR